MHEPPPSPDLLLRHLDWVRGLARALAPDEASADDLVQDAWLRTRGARDESRGRAWLARVVANLARDQRRGEARRARRERAAAKPEAAPSDAELRDRMAGQETLARWVLELEEPYRRTLLLRWLEGHAPARIAALEDVPLATVHTRLSRGEARLRARAQRETDGGGRAWLVFLAGAPGAEVATHALTAPTMSPLLLLVLNMKFVVSLTVVAVVLWAFVRDPAPRNEPRTAHDTAPVEVLQPDVPDMASSDSSMPAGPAPERKRVSVKRDVDTQEVTPPEEGTSADLLVRVVDARGRPFPRATVGIFVGTGPSALTDMRATSEGPHALARFSDYERRLAQLPPGKSGWPRFVGLVMTGPEVVRLPLPVHGLPDEPLVLVVPPHGILRVRVVDLSGSPWHEATWIQLASLASRADWLGAADRDNSVSAFVDDASEFEWSLVPIGVELLLEVIGTGIIRGAEHRIAPLGPGETRDVEVVIGATYPHARGRFVAADGTALGGHRPSVEFESRGSASIDELGPTGEFILPLDDKASLDGRFRARVECDVGWPQRRILVGTFEGVVPADGGAVEVGVVELRDAPIAAEGRVVDGRGVPIEGVYVALLSRINQRADPEDFTWSFATGYARSDALGAFRLEGVFPPGEYGLRTFDTEWIDRGVLRFRLGTRGLELVVDPVQRLAGRVLLPDGADPSELVVRAVETSGSRERTAYHNLQAEPRSDGSFLLEGLRPTTVTLSLVRRDSSVALAALERIAPHVAPADRPAVLDPWDLRRDLHHLDVQIHCADGSALERGLVAVGRHVLPHAGGRLRALAPATWGDELWIVAPGHRPLRLDARDAPRRVDLERGIPVTLHCDEPRPAVPDGWTVDVSLMPEAPPWVPEDGFIVESGFQSSAMENLWREQVPVAAGTTEWQLLAPIPGAYRPEWTIVKPSAELGGGSRLHVVTTESQRFDLIVESGRRGPSKARVGFDRVGFARALEWLGR